MAATIEPYDAKHIEGMCSLYNGETAFEGHIAPMTCTRFVDLVASKAYFDADGLFVAEEDGRVVGWVHAYVGPNPDSSPDDVKTVAAIRMLIYPRESLSVGGELMQAALGYLRSSGQTRFLAMHPYDGYPFYRGLWLGGEPQGPATMPHVQLALEVAGFAYTHADVCMLAEMPGPPEVFTSPDIEIVEAATPVRHSAHRESWTGFEPMTFTAMLDGEDVGQVGWVFQECLAEKLGAPAMNIWSLGVNKEHRRKGIALALNSLAMRRAYEQGARYTSVCTQIWNAPAQAAYGKNGFRVHNVVIGRTWEGKAEEQ